MGYWDALEPIWNAELPSDDPRRFLDWFETLSRSQKVLFPTHLLCSEVYNGGFHQYFTNTTGLHAPEAVTGFRELGLGDIADLVEKTVSIFGAEFPRERKLRQEFLDSFEGDEPEDWNTFHRFDDLFYERIKIPGTPHLSDEDRFTIAADQYVATHGN